MSDWSTLFSPTDGYQDLAKLGAPLSPLDGRYRTYVSPLANLLSEAALNRARVHVEIEWLIFLLDHTVLPGAPQLTDAERDYLRELPREFGPEQIERLAHIEATTRHDVKAVEYLIKEYLDAAPTALNKNAGVHADSPDATGALQNLDGQEQHAPEAAKNNAASASNHHATNTLSADPDADTVLPSLHEVVHIFCTSEDINNLAYALTIKAGVEQVWLPAADALADRLADMARSAADVPMLAHTHGQPATPVTLGKELAVFVYRLRHQIARVAATEYLGKINGATGTWAAHAVAVPGADWPALSRQFVEGLGLTWNPLTTQIESHDWQVDLYQAIAHFNRIAHNLATDCWTYISMGYFHQNLAAQGSTGSSTMPHKVNPIRFENAEANLEISCALLDELAQTLVTSRMQRDLTDSTTQRNIGVAFGHSLLAMDNLTRGLAGLDVAASVMAEDLEGNWAVLGEAVQQAMRAASIAGATGMEDPYERLKELTRGHSVSAEDMRAFISSLGMPADVEERLLALTPASYHGLAEEMVAWL